MGQSQERGKFAKLLFERFEGFNAEPVVLVDNRRDYGEDRFRAFGRIDGEPYSIAYAVRGENWRLISFRRAHEKEVDRYD